MQGLAVKLAALTAAVGAALFVVVPAMAANVITNPTTTQTIVYGRATVGTIFKMAAGATADPLDIVKSTGAKVFSVSPAGNVTIAGKLTVAGVSALKNTTVTGTFGVSSTSALHNTTVTGTLGVSSLTTLHGLTVASGAVNLSAASSLTLKARSVADGALSTNVALLNAAAPAFTHALSAAGLNSSGDLSVGSMFTVTAADGSVSSGDITAGNIRGTGTLVNAGDMSVGPLDIYGGVSNPTLEVDTVHNIVTVTGTLDYTALNLTTVNALTATGGLTVSGGTLSVDGGLITSDGSGNLSASGVGATNLGGTNLTIVGGTVSLPANSVQNSALQADVALYDAVAPTFTGNLTVDGSFSSDGGMITSDGAGTLTVAGLTIAPGGTFTLPAGSIADTALSANIPRLDAASNTFAHDLQAASEEISGKLTTSSLYTTGPVTWASVGDPNSYNVNTANQTLTTDDLLINRVAIITVASGSNTITTPSAADIVAAIPGVATGDAFSFTLDNNDAATFQIVTPGAGVTFPGVNYVRSNSQHTFYCRVEDATVGAEAVSCW